MAFLEWRRFTFFDLKKSVDRGKLAEYFKVIESESDITIATSGHNDMVLGDSSGYVHLISRTWTITTFRAYELRIVAAQQMRNSSLLITIGEDEPGVNPLIKVWDTSKEKNGTFHCSRVSRAIPGNRPIAATVLCVHENLQLMAVGFVDGSLVLYRGDVRRDRGSKPKLLKDTNSSVTGLTFKTTANVILLFVATESSVFVYNVTHKDREQKSALDAMGCAKHCSVLAESVQESHFMVGRSDAIYCYTTDGRGPCFAVDGEKVMLDWFRSYLIIVSNMTRPLSQTLPTGGAPTTSTPLQGHSITILDIQNKFIVFSAHMTRVKAILSGWGALYIIDCNNHVYILDEKDLQSKLALLFKKNLYDVSIRIAKSQQYDADGLVDIFRQYGDHLYAKGDYWGAIEQYAKTIGRLEPSYVIRKFLDSQHTEKLTSYLQALHKEGQASEDHTTLLLNCCTKLNKPESLKEFILNKDHDLDYDVDIAIKVCRQSSPQEALVLAKKHAKHDWYIKLQIEDHAHYRVALEYIAALDLDAAEAFMKKYGQVLIQHVPHESTQFLKRLCTDYRVGGSRLLLDDSGTHDNHFDVQKADPEDYIHLFLNRSERLVEFLEHLIAEGCILSTAVYDTLFEHYLHVWRAMEADCERAKVAQKAIKLLQNPDIKYDRSQAIVVCHMTGFSEGVLYLYEEEKLYQQILRYHMSRGDANSVLTCCRRFGHQDPTLWVQALWSCVRETQQLSTELLPEVLTVIARERLLSAQMVIEAIGTGKADIMLATIRRYVLSELKRESDTTRTDTELTTKYRHDIDKLKQQLETLKHDVIVVQGSRCAACHHQLELPSVHFLCQHSYHQHCFQSFSDSESECPACVPQNATLLELLKAREHNKDLHETFHSQLEKAHDGFALAAEYFGRGVFNKVTVVKEVEAVGARAPPPTAAPLAEARRSVRAAATPPQQPVAQSYGAGAEARMRQVEAARDGGGVYVPMSEGRMRLQERQYMSRSLEGGAPVVAKAQTQTRKEVRGESKNPFGDEYDEAKNPFGAEDEADDERDDDEDEKNPFNDDYDKNLNPFGE